MMHYGYMPPEPDFWISMAATAVGMLLLFRQPIITYARRVLTRQHEEHNAKH